MNDDEMTEDQRISLQFHDIVNAEWTLDAEAKAQNEQARAAFTSWEYIDLARQLATETVTYVYRQAS